MPGRSSAEVLSNVDFENQEVGEYTLADIEKDWAAKAGWKIEKAYNTKYLSIVNEQGNKVLQSKNPSGVAGGAGQGSFEVYWPFSYEEIYLSYKIKYADNFHFTRTGKQPRLEGGSGPSGCGRKPNTANMSTNWGTYSSSDLTHWKISAYVYHQDQPGDCGEGGGTSAGKLNRGQWYRTQTHVKMNSSGQKNGIFEIWVNEKKVYTRTNYRFRNSNSFAIDRFDFKTHFGGGDEPKYRPIKDEYVYFDDFVVSTEPFAQPPINAAQPPLRPTGVKLEKRH